MRIFFRTRRNVFIECERFDAEITARDNALINKENEMLVHLFQQKGDGTLSCPHCGGVIGTGQYIFLVGGIPHHNYCGRNISTQLKEAQNADKTRNEWGYPLSVPKG